MINQSLAAELAGGVHALAIHGNVSDWKPGSKWDMRVVKNTLARKAFAGTAFEPVGPKLKGPLLLAFSKDDPGAAARVVKAFAKDNEKLVATLVSLGGEVLSAKDINKVASLPTRDQARAQLLGLLMSPAQQLAAVIAAPATDLARVIAAFAEKRKGEAGAPA